MAGVLKDLKYAVTTLAKRPGFSLMIVGMLGLGIAGNTAIFSIFNGLFLRPLPFSEPHRLMDLDETAPRWDLEYVSIAYPDFDAWREENRSFDAMAVFKTEDVNLFLNGEARRIQAARVTHDLPSVLKINPLLGRHITVEEDQPGAPKVVLLGYGLWQEQFGGDPSVLGDKLLLDSEPYTIVGVLPTEALFVGDADLWVPLATDAHESPGRWYLQGIGRLKDSVTLDQAREDLNRIHKNRIESRPANKITSPVVTPVLDRYLGQYRLGTTALLGAVGIVLLIACANIAGLMLARSSSRAKEIGIRVALGAARRRVVQQLLTESLVLSALGAILGTLLGFWILRMLVKKLTEPASLEVEVYYAKTMDNAEYFQGHYLNKIEAEKRTETVDFPAGSFFVPAGQPKSNLICYILEPETNDNLVTWGFLDTYLRTMTEEETKEYLEMMARRRARGGSSDEPLPPGQLIPMYRLMKKAELEGFLVDAFNTYERNRHVR